MKTPRTGVETDEGVSWPLRDALGPLRCLPPLCAVLALAALAGSSGTTNCVLERSSAWLGLRARAAVVVDGEMEEEEEEEEGWGFW